MTDALASPTPSVSTLVRLREVAAALFAERGYGGTSMADIAERVGVRKASLYNYYPSKEDLLLELLESGLDAWEECCAAALTGEGLYAQRLWRFFRAAVEFTTEHPELVAIARVAATQIGGELGERVECLVAERRHTQREVLERFFAEAAAAGETAAGEPADLAYVYRMFANGVLTGHLACCTGDERLSGERLQRVWEVFWAGLAPEGR